MITPHDANLARFYDALGSPTSIACLRLLLQRGSATMAELRFHLKSEKKKHLALGKSLTLLHRAGLLTVTPKRLLRREVQEYHLADRSQVEKLLMVEIGGGT